MVPIGLRECVRRVAASIKSLIRLTATDAVSEQFGLIDWRQRCFR